MIIMSASLLETLASAQSRISSLVVTSAPLYALKSPYYTRGRIVRHGNILIIGMEGMICLKTRWLGSLMDWNFNSKFRLSRFG